jgi:arabinose-5-phosphate isomerase
MIVDDIISEISCEFDSQIKNIPKYDILKMVDIIKSRKGNIYFTGIGKSGNIAKHCCDLFKCINIPSFYLDSININHGDIGVINEDDIIILYSNSGNTIELINNIPLFKIKKALVIGVCCNRKSKFSELCDFTIVTPFNKEISGNINKIPTNSFMSHLIFTNIVVSILKNEIELDEYRVNHSSGDIGESLLKIKDKLIQEYPTCVFHDETISINLANVLLEMTKYSIGCCFFVNKENELIGILTDGDIRRYLISNFDKKFISIKDINTKFYYETDFEKYLYECNECKYIPILENKIIKGIIMS